jgi:hypothetical protein
MIAGALQDASGSMDDEALSRGSSVIIAAMDGLQVQWLLEPAAVDMPAAVEAVVQGVLRKLAEATPAQAVTSIHSSSSGIDSQLGEPFSPVVGEVG